MTARPPIADLIAAYLQERALELAALSLAAYQDDLQGFVADLAPMDPRDASSQDVTAWVQVHTRDPKVPGDTRPWSRSTARRRMAALRGWYEWMVDLGHCARNPCARLRIKVPRRTAPIRFSEAEIGRFFEAGRAAATRDEQPEDHNAIVQAYAICLLSYVFALRIEEILSVERRSLDRSGEPWRLTTLRKGGKVRTYLLPEDTDARAALAVALRQPVTGDPQFLFTNARTGHRWTRRSILRVMQQWAEAAGWPADRLEGWSPHAFRHSRAYHLVNDGRAIHDVQDLLDHANLTTTTLYVQHDQRGGDRLLADEVHRPLPGTSPHVAIPPHPAGHDPLPPR